jgi:hypothetical protein
MEQLGLASNRTFYLLTKPSLEEVIAYLHVQFQGAILH